jgi:multiple sugar transport system ATP-binding protein
MASITLNRVGKTSPNGQVAVRDVSCDIADGELLVLLGPSGSGKSTVLRLIAGLETATTGRIALDGRDVTRVPPQERDLAMVFQNYALYPHKTVRENLAFGLRVRRVDPADIDTRVRAAAATLGIETLLDRRPAQLSGGQRQRVALGRAIVREPRAFLLDEPLSNLDPMLRVDTRTELAVLHRRLGATMVYVTHDQEEAMTLGTRIAVMRNGGIEQIDAPLDLFRRPANTFVARFVGSPAMNLWRATWDAADGRLRVIAPSLSIDVTDCDDARGRELSVGVRPHDIELVSDGEGDAAGRIQIVEPLGAVTVIHLRIEGLPDDLVRVVVPADRPLAVDAAVAFRVRRDRVHLFDGTTGVRLGGNGR